MDDSQKNGWIFVLNQAFLLHNCQTMATFKAFVFNICPHLEIPTIRPGISRLVWSSANAALVVHGMRPNYA